MVGFFRFVKRVNLRDCEASGFGSLTAQDWSSSGPPALYMYNTPKLYVIVTARSYSRIPREIQRVPRHLHAIASCCRHLSLLLISSPPWYLV